MWGKEQCIAYRWIKRSSENPNRKNRPIRIETEECLSHLVNEFGTSAWVENPKKNGVVRRGPYLASSSRWRVPGNGGSDIIEGLLTKSSANARCDHDWCAGCYCCCCCSVRRFWRFQGAATSLSLSLCAVFSLVETTGSTIFQSSFFSFSVFSFFRSLYDGFNIFFG